MSISVHTIVALSFWVAILLVVLGLTYALLRRWRAKRYRFSLVALFAVFIVVGCLLALLKGPVDRHLAARHALREVHRLGGSVDALGNVFLNGTDADDATLILLRSIPDVYTLQLRDTHITDAGLAELKHFPKLGGLDIRGTRVTKQRLEVLRMEFPHCNIAWE